jgi:polar amino acid transport system substrate-binding protein
MLKVLKVMLAVLAAVAVVSMAGCSGTKSLIIGIETNALPLCGKNTDGEPDGFIVEMAREAGKRMEMEVSFKFVDMDDKETDFTAKGVNALWGKIVPDAQNKQTMLFTKSYLSDSQVLVVESSSKIDGKSDLKGKTIGAVKNSAAKSALLKSGLCSNAISGKPVEYNELVSAFLALDGSKTDALAVDESYAQYLMTEHAEQYRILDGKLGSEEYAVAVRRNDSSLRDALDSALKAMKADGTSKNISIKWFGVDMT